VPVSAYLQSPCRSSMSASGTELPLLILARARLPRSRARRLVIVLTRVPVLVRVLVGVDSSVQLLPPRPAARARVAVKFI
jgi:hypothetical protein